MQTLTRVPAHGDLARWLLVGFVGGAIAVILFHQGLGELLYTMGLTSRAPYSFAPTRPWGIPQLWSLAFWGGVWGLVLAAVLVRASGPAQLLLGAMLFGAVLPSLAAWFVVAPLKGQPVAAGGAPAAMLVAVLLNGVWGLGTGFALALLGRASPETS